MHRKSVLLAISLITILPLTTTSGFKLRASRRNPIHRSRPVGSNGWSSANDVAPSAEDDFEEENDDDGEGDDFNTSCKKINCGYVENYPQTSIDRAFLEQKLEAKKDSISSIFADDDDARILDDNENIEKYMNYFGSACETRTDTFELKEALDLKNHSHLVVHYANNFRVYSPTATECSAPEFCVDSSTPRDYLYHCKNKIVNDYVYTYDKSSGRIDETEVKRAAGCFCRERHQSKFDPRYLLKRLKLMQD